MVSDDCDGENVAVYFLAIKSRTRVQRLCFVCKLDKAECQRLNTQSDDLNGVDGPEGPEEIGEFTSLR